MTGYEARYAIAWFRSLVEDASTISPAALKVSPPLGYVTQRVAMGKRIGGAWSESDRCGSSQSKSGI